MTAIEASRELRAALPTPNRVMAPFMWYGGKGQLAKWIKGFLPRTKVYHEPYAGAASLFWHTEPRSVEVLNDLHTEIITTYRVLQDAEKFEQLSHRLTWTPYSFDEFKRARRMEPEAETLSDVDRAWAFLVRQNMGFGGKCTCDGDWGRKFTASRGMAQNASAWRGRLSLLETWHDRLSRVQLDNRCALQSLKYWDGAETLHYVDPPYAAETRAKGKREVYRHEAGDNHHELLVELLLTLEGPVILSGYLTPLYSPLTDAGWRLETKQTSSSAAGRVRGSGLQGKGSASAKVPRTEALWINPKANRLLGCLPEGSVE
jgi:DNA adenine methylase